MKASKKTEKTVKFIANDRRGNKDISRTPTRKNDNYSSTKNLTPKMNTVSEIQVRDSDQRMDMEDNDSMGWKNLSDIATASEDSNSSDTDGTE